MEKFRKLIQRVSEERESKVILSADRMPNEENVIGKLIEIIEKVENYICAVKIGRQITVKEGINGVKPLIQRVKRAGLPIIFDSKLNDVAHTNRIVVYEHYKAGINAEIVSPLPGFEGGLRDIIEMSREWGYGIILLTYMSNPGAKEMFEAEIIDPHEGRLRFYEKIARMAEKWMLDGMIVGATRPRILRHIRNINENPIYAVGIGKQGGKIEEAIKNGANYLIIGRSIITSEKPEEIAYKYARESWKVESII